MITQCTHVRLRLRDLTLSPIQPYSTPSMERRLFVNLQAKLPSYECRSLYEVRILANRAPET